ncbi:MAG TPA: CBS domain-containing protein [Candidatus Eisenbacteria bacterium]|nr:CBS domain-containing protein [Candidatus Eisenbacteria bacterium]
MLASDIMSRKLICCTPWDTVRTAARLMRRHGVGALPVVSDLSDSLLEGIVTDRDLCCGVLADGKNADAVKVEDVMTRVPVTCEPNDPIGVCEERMQEDQIRRIPVVNKQGRCVGIIAQADIAHRAPAAHVAETLREISKAARPRESLLFEPDRFYCGQLHEQDEILLLQRRRELRRELEAA